MYAVIQAGGRQVKVSQGQEVRIDKIAGDVGNVYHFEKVLMIGGGERIHLGQPYLEGVTLESEILGHGKAKKVLIFKKRRRKNYRRKRGFRAEYTLVRIGGLKGLEVDWTPESAMVAEEGDEVELGDVETA